MNQNWDEKKIKELFLELKQAEERFAPPFASVWEAAASRIEKARHPWRVFRVAAVTVMLILLGGAVFIFFRQSARQSAPTKTPGSGVSRTESPSPTLPLFKPPGEERPKAVRRRRRPARPRPSALFISQWRPPTDFLLKSPGEQLLKTVPRLGESVVEIKAIMPEEKN